jgi:hypothetical protein
MRADDNLQYAYEELRVMAQAVGDENGVADGVWLNTIAEAIRVFAEEYQFALKDPYPEED